MPCNNNLIITKDDNGYENEMRNSFKPYNLLIKLS